MTSPCVHNKVRNALALASFAVTGLLAGLLWLAAGQSIRAEQRIQQVLDFTPNALIVCNLDQEIVYSNPQASEVTGYTREELKAGGVLLLVPDEWKADHERKMQQAIEMYRDCDTSELPKIHVSKVLAVKCKDGKLLRATVTAIAIANEQTVEFFAWIIPLPQEDLTGDLPQKKFKPAQ